MLRKLDNILRTLEFAARVFGFPIDGDAAYIQACSGVTDFDMFNLPLDQQAFNECVLEIAAHIALWVGIDPMYWFSMETWTSADGCPCDYCCLHEQCEDESDLWEDEGDFVPMVMTCEYVEHYAFKRE